VLTQLISASRSHIAVAFIERPIGGVILKCEIDLQGHISATSTLFKIPVGLYLQWVTGYKSKRTGIDDREVLVRCKLGDATLLSSVQVHMGLSYLIQFKTRKFLVLSASSNLAYPYFLVLESPVQFGFLTQNEKTETRTSPHTS
jgi:hypothetical protein